MACQREVLEVTRIAVEALQKGRGGENVPAGPQDAKHLTNCDVRPFKMLKNGLAVHHADAGRAKRKSLSIRNDIDVREWREIQIQKARVSPQWPAANRNAKTRGFAHGDVECSACPAATRGIDLPKTARE
jgi:hypothetical protein